MTENKRKHMRFPNSGLESIHIAGEINGAQIEKLVLIHDESFESLSGVYIGKDPFRIDDIVIWMEAPTIKTPCSVIRCVKLSNDIWNLVLKIEKLC